MSNRKPMRPKNVALLGISIALVAAMTTMLVPIPATKGYFNLGEVVIFFLAFMFGWKEAAIAGAIGAGIIDLAVAPVFMPATLVAKFLEGATAGLVVSSLKGVVNVTWVRTLAVGVGGSLMITTYFLYEWFILPLGLSESGGLGNALAELPFNILQVLLCGSIAMLLAVGITRSYPQIANLLD
ncbi:MAG TPA: ECF transporter S component [Thermoplasmata archaeon]|nr:ECF transporter S component [Thermoplasmata archaeon]